MQTLFQSVRAAASSRAWSLGVEIARAEAVAGERENAQEIVLRISPSQGLQAPLVTLYPEDEDWECNCRGEEDPCEHVAAAVIALRKARVEGKPLPSGATGIGRLRYHFDSSARPGLALRREVVSGERVEELKYGLTALAASKTRGPRFDANARDMKVEQILGSRGTAIPPPEKLPALFATLEGCERVVLDGRPVQVSGEIVFPIARVVDAPGGVRLFVEQDPAVSRSVGAGAVLCGETLRAVGDPRLSGREREELPKGRFYSHDQLPEFTTEILPSLAARLPVDVQTSILPETTRAEQPRIQLEVERREDQLSILPTLVYGKPPSARIDAGRLVHLEGPIPVRDQVAERQAIRDLERELGLSPSRRVNLAAEDAIAVAERIRAWRGEVRGDAHQDFRRSETLIPRLQIDDDRIDLSFALPARPASNGAEHRASEATSASASSVLNAWRRGESLVSLGESGFAPLPADWLERFGHRVSDLLAARDDRQRVPTCALPDLGALCEDLDEAPPAALEGLRPLLDGFSGIPETTPPDLVGELRSYQQRGVDWLIFLRRAGLGALLADDMGLGKTLQAICSLEAPCLIVMPTSLLHNWQEELTRFRPPLGVRVYHGPNRSLEPETDVLLTSYAILRLDIDALADRHWRTVILDEAQNIKNPESQVAQAAFRLQADFRIALTGTPVENRLEELWSQLHFLNRGLLGGRSGFQEHYANPIAQGDAESAGRLRERVRPFVLRRLKRDVAPELPPRSEIVLHCELDSEEREIYDSVRAASLRRVVKELREGGNVMAALEALLRLRQAACHPGLVPGHEAQRSTKVDLLVDRLGQAVDDGHKALVFSQWTSLLDRVESPLRDVGIDFLRLDGSTRDRPGVISRFTNEADTSVMLVSLRAGGTGLNLTAADHVFLLDPWWNPAVEDQAADRAHRIGQTRPVVVHRLVARETVEEKILELHAHKRALSEAALGGGEMGGDRLSREDLLMLLESA